MFKNIILLIKAILFFIITASTVFAAHSIIIDTDVGTDDMLAMIYLLNERDINVKAITLAAAGEAHCAQGFQNVSGMLSITNKKNIPVACGRELPLKGNNHFPDYIRNEADQLAGAAKQLPKTANKPKMNALSLLNKVFSTSSESIDILAIGPLTNIAEFIQHYPTFKKKIRMVYIMGGALNVPGNIKGLVKTSKNDTAEWNIYVDPLAADIVFRSGIPITLVPLDVTNQAPVSLNFYNQLAKKQQNKLKQFTFELFHANKAEILSGQWYFWDSLAAIILGNESIVNITPMKLAIKLGSDNIAGTTFVDQKKGKIVRVCMGLKNTKQVESSILKIVS